MYTSRPWTMRQYAGFGTAAESNARYHQLIDAGTAGLSVAFDLPTQMGYDSDAPIAARRGRQGRGGDRLDRGHAQRSFDGIPLGQGVHVDDDQRARRRCCCCSTSWSPRSRASPRATLTGTIQNDVLKEYIARGTYIYPPEPSLRLVSRHLRVLPRARCRAGTRSRSPATTWPRPGATPAQEIAFTLANGIAVRPGGARQPGLAVDDFAPAAVASSSWPAPRCWRRSRSSAPRAGSGRGVMRDEFGRADPQAR